MGNTQPSPYTHPDQSKHGEDQLIQESQARPRCPHQQGHGARVKGVDRVDQLAVWRFDGTDGHVPLAEDIHPLMGVYE